MTTKEEYESAKKNIKRVETIQKEVKDFLNSPSKPNLFQEEKTWIMIYNPYGELVQHTYKSFGLHDSLLRIFHNRDCDYAYNESFHYFFLKALNQVCLEHLEEIFYKQKEMAERNALLAKQRLIKETQDILNDLEKQ